MVRYDLLTKINQTLNRDGGTLGLVSDAQEAVS
jgi:glycerol-3-phosphate acyltransferase PlsX